MICCTFSTPHFKKNSPLYLIKATERILTTPSRHRERMRTTSARCLRNVSGVWNYHRTRRGSALGRRERRRKVRQQATNYAIFYLQVLFVGVKRRKQTQNFLSMCASVVPFKKARARSNISAQN